MADMYNNSRCTICRQTIVLLEENNIQANIIDYISQPPHPADLKVLVKKLGLSPRSLLRKNEAVYKEIGLKDPVLSGKVLFEAMSQYTKLIERPIVVHHDKAILGPRPEAVLELFAL